MSTWIQDAYARGAQRDAIHHLDAGTVQYVPPHRFWMNLRLFLMGLHR